MPELSYLEAIRQALWQEMKRDERVFLLGEDIGRYGGAFGLTHGMLDEFGEERVLETPISEAAIVAAAIGAALLGTIGTALTFLGINPFWERAIQGGIILAALVADVALARLERHGAKLSPAR